jgi:hypothetical protein
VIVQCAVAGRPGGDGQDPGAVAVVQGRPRDPDRMRDAVTLAAAALADALGLAADLVFVTWPHPGTAATGEGALP